MASIHGTFVSQTYHPVPFGEGFLAEFVIAGPAEYEAGGFPLVNNAAYSAAEGGAANLEALDGIVHKVLCVVGFNLQAPVDDSKELVFDYTNGLMKIFTAATEAEVADESDQSAVQIRVVLLFT